jgi:hypothetical protein
MPGLWSLLPFSVGLFCLLWQLIAQRAGYRKETLLFAVAGLAVYPPIAVFIVPILCAEIIRSGSLKKSLSIISGAIGIGILAIGYVMNHLGLSLHDIGKYLIRPLLDPGTISYPLWHVLPPLVALLGIVGVVICIRQRYVQLVISMGIGIVYWIVYASLAKVIIIEYPRIVVITSFFMIVASGVALEWVIAKISSHAYRMRLQSGLFIVIAAASIISVFTGGYTARSAWQHMVLTMTAPNGARQTIQPAAPVNRYLTAEDIRLFEGITGKVFIAPPWKGLVLGVATRNYPLETKASTITTRTFEYRTFMQLDCKGKTNVAHRYNLSYVYSTPFSCAGFNPTGTSSEGLYLYRFLQEQS